MLKKPVPFRSPKLSCMNNRVINFRILSSHLILVNTEDTLIKIVILVNLEKIKHL